MERDITMRSFGLLLLCSVLFCGPALADPPSQMEAAKAASVNRKQDHLLIENRTTPDMR